MIGLLLPLPVAPITALSAPGHFSVPDLVFDGVVSEKHTKVQRQSSTHKPKIRQKRAKLRNRKMKRWGNERSLYESLQPNLTVGLHHVAHDGRGSDDDNGRHGFCRLTQTGGTDIQASRPKMANIVSKDLAHGTPTRMA